MSSEGSGGAAVIEYEEKRSGVMREAPDDDPYARRSTSAAARHLHDANSAFHHYRIANVLGLHTPGPTDSVLDLGTGWGTIAFVVAPLAREVVGLDLSDHSVSLCRDRLAHADPAPNNVRFMQGDARDCGLPSESFDVVYAADLFEHLWPDESNLTVAEAYRVLRTVERFGKRWIPLLRRRIGVVGRKP